MCDTLVALAPATATGRTIFAKNSDRPPGERQVVLWSPPRHDVGSLRATHVPVDAHTGPTLGCLLSVPDWGWGAEHGVNEAGVAIGNEAIYTTLDPRSVAPALTGLDLVRLGLERAVSAAQAVEVIIGLLERSGQGGTDHDPGGSHGPKAYWSSFLVANPTAAWVLETSGREWAVHAVDVEGRPVEDTTSSIVAELHPSSPSRAWVLTGHPCEREYVEVPVSEGAVEILSATDR